MASGAGAAALACLDLMVTLGARHENIMVTDIEGVVYKGRTALMDPRKEIYARETGARTLAEVIDGADVFLGLSAAGVLKKEMLARMAEKPLIMALANPNPEIDPKEALEARPDAMICTGRSDYPNQVNNVLCFPYIFRGALDVSASAINEAMKLAAVHAIAKLAHEAPSDVVAKAYGGTSRLYGRDNLIPSPFDERLILRIAPAVAKAAMESGVARKPIEDFEAYQDQLSRFVFRSGFIMKPLFESARKDPKRVIYADGEDERVLSAVQSIREERIAECTVIGRPDVIKSRLERYGLTIRPDADFAIIDPEDDPRYRDYVQTYVEAAGRLGITPASARTLVRTNNTIIAAIALKRGDADAMICGLVGGFHKRLRSIKEIIGLMPGVDDFSAMSMLITTKGPLFITDTQVNHDPNARDIAEMARMSAWHVRQFGIEPKIALRLAFRFRHGRLALGLQDARGAGDSAGDRARPRGRRRDAGGHRARPGGARSHPARLDTQGRGQHPGHAQHRRGQHRLSAHQGDGGRLAGRADPDRRGAAGAYPHTVDDGARHHEHDGARGGRSAGRKPQALTARPGETALRHRRDRARARIRAMLDQRCEAAAGRTASLLCLSWTRRKARSRHAVSRFASAEARRVGIAAPPRRPWRRQESLAEASSHLAGPSLKKLGIPRFKQLA